MSAARPYCFDQVELCRASTGEANPSVDQSKKIQTESSTPVSYGTFRDPLFYLISLLSLRSRYGRAIHWSALRPQAAFRRFPFSCLGWVDDRPDLQSRAMQLWFACPALDADYACSLLDGARVLWAHFHCVLRAPGICVARNNARWEWNSLCVRVHQYVSWRPIRLSLPSKQIR